MATLVIIGASPMLLGAVAGASPVGTTPHWTNLTAAAGTPGDRSDAGFAWNVPAGRGVLYGGLQPNGVVRHDTWMYNGTWNLVPTPPSSAPAGRWGIQTGMAYDAADGVILLFGGSVGYIGSGAADTWEYANGHWINLTAKLNTSPSARYAASMAYDAADGYVVLFGGAPYWGAPTCYNDTWAFSHGRWTLLNLSVAPSPRRAANLVYDRHASRLVLFGGSTAGFGALSDSWSFSKGAWHLLPAKGPPARWWGAMVYDPVLRSVVLFGGAAAGGCGTVYGDTWILFHGKWTNATRSYHLTVAPSPRCSMMAIYDPVSREMIVYGGLTASGNSGETWAFG